MQHDIYGSIIIRGARENNLKSVSLDIPKRKITVFTGVSGSGKSSLVFGTHIRIQAQALAFIGGSRQRLLVRQHLLDQVFAEK